MAAITLTRVDHARRMARFYMLDVQPDLFGQWCFIREWGRIGRSGQQRNVPYPTENEAHAALARQRRVKERRGYRVSSGSGKYPVNGILSVSSNDP
jgi:predicted DNA-binding WGR domain protein